MLLPGVLPVGLDPETGQLELVREFRLGKRRFVPTAVGALVPPGYTRTFLPGGVRDVGPPLPQWAYTAAAWGPRGPVVWAVRTDARRHWDADRFSTPDLEGRVADFSGRYSGNPVVAQLATCALVYRCYTSQNFFFGRDEGALPSSPKCNARCLGCISEQPEDGPPASHARLSALPTAEEMAEVGAHHLAFAKGRTQISFGQGCEGEPLTRSRQVARAIVLMRKKTSRGSIHLNTNASLPLALAKLFDAGLDSVRVSLNSARRELYEVYYRPAGYGWEQVEASLALARRRGAYIALNLLVFPGVSDRRGEVEALVKLVRRHRVDQVQTRSLCIDPFQYLELARGHCGSGPNLSVRGMIAALRRAAPWLVIGNFARALGER